MTTAKLALQIAGNLVERGKLDAARDVLAPIVSAADAPPSALWLAGRIAGLASQPDAAIVLLERARALAPNAVPIYEDLAFAWGAAGLPERASEILAAGIAAIGPDPRLVASAAAYDLEQLDRDAARARLADPAARAAYPRVRALLAIHEGDWAAARASYAEAFGIPAPAAPPAEIRTPPRYAPGAPPPPDAPTRPVVATSLSPRGGEMQRAAANSWLGFAAEVISVNSTAEIATLAPEYPGVRFVETTRNGADLIGKPLVLIDDILAALEATGASRCGIVNGDIHLADADRLAADIAAAGADALTVCHRLDVDSPASPSGSVYTTGFDAFFFPTRHIAHFRGSGLMLGAPWWDYLFPALAIAESLPLAIPAATAIRHVRHAIQWSTSSYVATSRLWLDRIRTATVAHDGGVAAAFLEPFVALFDQANAWTREPLSDDAADLEAQKQSLNVLATAMTHLIRTQAAAVAASR